MTKSYEVHCCFRCGRLRRRGKKKKTFDYKLILEQILKFNFFFRDFAMRLQKPATTSTETVRGSAPFEMIVVPCGYE